MKIIAVTGTKGKTSIINLVDWYLRKNNSKVIKVTSNGIFTNNKMLYSNDYFIEKYGASANTTFLKKFKENRNLINNCEYLLLEMSYSIAEKLNGSFLENNIDISCLTNIYKDHIGGMIKNRRELRDAKFKIINNTKKEGNIILGIDRKKDDLSYQLLKRNKSGNYILYGPKHPFLESKIKEGFRSLVIDGNKLFYHNDHKKSKIVELNKFNVCLNGKSSPLKRNLSAAIGIISSLKNKNKKKDIIQISNYFKKIKNSLDFNLGRMNIFKRNGNLIMLDFAHEKNSIEEAVKTLKKMGNKEKTIGVIRLSYYRDLDYIKDLTRKIVPLFDKIYIYDKCKSRKGKIKERFINKFGYEEGKVADVMEEVAKEIKGEKIIKKYNEFEAIADSINKNSNSNIFIMGDQLKKDIEIIKGKD